MHGYGAAGASGKVYVADYVTDADVNVANFERKESTGTERVLCLNATDGTAGKANVIGYRVGGKTGSGRGVTRVPTR